MKTKEELTELYEQIPEDVRKQIIEINSEFERIGPFELPIELPSGCVSLFRLNHFFMLDSEESYFVLTPKENKLSNPLLRIESACVYAHIFNSRRCDCRFQLINSLEKINNEQNGLLIFCLNQHGKSIPGGTRGHALIYSLGQIQNQELVHDAYVKNGFEEDYRNYEDIIKILKHLKVNKLRLLTNNPKRIDFLKENNIQVTRVPLEKEIDSWASEELYFKKTKLGHLLNCSGFKSELLKTYNLKP